MFVEGGIVWRQTGEGFCRYKEGWFVIRPTVLLLLKYCVSGSYGLAGTVFGK